MRMMMIIFSIWMINKQPR